jgi:hypothetical protein
VSHLSPDELRQWFERGQAADRERVITHLADCDACRRSLSALATATEIESTPSLTVAEAVPKGYAARRPAPGLKGRSAWLRPAYGLAGAALVVLAVVWLSTPGAGPDDGGAVRSSELLAVAPVGATNATEFRWESPFEATRYRVSIRDGNDGLVHFATVTASPLLLDDQTRRRLKAGESYTWQVEALGRTGDVIAESKPATFRYQP